MYAYSGWYAGAPWSWMSMPSSSPSSEMRRSPIAFTAYMSTNPAANVATVDDHAALDLCHQLAGVAAVEDALHEVRRHRRRSCRLRTNPRLRVPQMPQTPWTANAPHGSSTRIHSVKSTARTTIAPAIAPMMIAPVGDTQ